MAAQDIPTGTVTFLFTDIEGSTRLWEADRQAMDAALAIHDRLLRNAFDQSGGYVFSTGGDGFAVAFSTPESAIAAAEAALRDINTTIWPTATPLKVRFAVHAGSAEERDGDYFGQTVNRCARLMAAGHGGQLLVSHVTAQLLARDDLVDLGVHRLKDLSAPEQIWQLGDHHHPPLRTLDSSVHNLPPQRTELIGREAEVADVAAKVRENRLVSLLGIGGTGKTRLAVAVAADLAPEFPDGVWFVDLVPVNEGHRIVETIADVAGFALAGAGSPASHLADLLRRRRLLLVLDNCEHLTAEVALFVDGILASTQTPRILVTSREALDLPDECQIRVPPLAADDARSPALALFQAAAARVGVTLGERDRTLAGQLCRRLDGLPLALELAAAQLRHTGMAELTTRLDRRFEILQRERRGANVRQASLIGVMQDSWEMLDAAMREMLQQLAAFPSTFDLSAVEALAENEAQPSAGRVLAALVDRSLVVSGGDGTLRLLETVKLFARQQWADPDSYRDRHARWCLEMLRSYPPGARHASIAMVGWATAHYDDLRAAEDHLAKRNRTADVVELLALQGHTFQSGVRVRASAAITRIDRYLAIGGLDELQVGLLQLVAAAAALPGRQPERMRTSSEAAVESLRGQGRDEDLASALLISSWNVALRDTETALSRVDEALALAEHAHADTIANVIRGYEANHLALAGRFTEAGALLLDLQHRLRTDPIDAPHHVLWLTVAGAMILEDPHRSLRAMEAIRTSSAEMGFHYTYTFMTLEACTAASTGDARRTADLVGEVMEEARRSGGSDDLLPDLLLAPALLAWRRGEIKLARRWMTAVRRAEKPTLTFQSTMMFRQLRATIGLDHENPLLNGSAEDVLDEAVSWLTAVVSGSDLR